MVHSDDFRLIGAKKVLLDAAKIKKEENLLIISHERLLPITEYILKAGKSLGFNNNIMLVVVPETLRPVTKITDMLYDALEKTDVCIYLVDRSPEETHIEWGPVRQTVLENGGRYLTMHDPEPWYFEKGGILADYKVVKKKNDVIVNILKESEKIHVTSELGTDLTFKIDLNYEIQERHPGSIFQQVPEGEVTCEPIQDSVNGTLVVDGVISGLGPHQIPVTYRNFMDGVCETVEGDDMFLSELVKYIQRCGGEPTLDSLDTIEEFALGTNDWAILDYNISNCEKVSGTIHFGIGHLKEWEHLDQMVTGTTVVSVNKNGEKTYLIKSGCIQI
jgi:hypothetical protein